MNAHGNLLAALLPVLMVGIVVALRFRSMRRERPLRPGSLWIAPAIYLLVAISALSGMKPPPAGWGLVLLGLAVGIGIGWHRGKLIQIRRDPDSGELSQRASPLALLLLAALIILKLWARSIFGDSAAGSRQSSAMLLSDSFIGFAFGLLAATRLEIYLRARKLLSR